MARGRGKLTPQDEQIKLIIAKNINHYLGVKNKKQKDLQEGTKISQSTLSDYVNGKTLPNLGNVEKIADYFGVLKSDIDPRFSSISINNHMDSPLTKNYHNKKIISIYDQLNEPRQEKVFDFANKQLKEQEEEEEEKQKITELDEKVSDEDIEEWVDNAAAFGGKPLSENDEEVAKRLLREFFDNQE